MAKKLLSNTLPPVVVGVGQPETVSVAEPVQASGDLILSLDATCRCGRRMAYKKNEKIWKCLRLHTGDEPTKRCQTEEDFDKIRDVYHPRNKTQAAIDMELEEDD